MHLALITALAVHAAADNEPPDGLGIEVAPKLGALIPTSSLGATYYLGFDVAYRVRQLDRFAPLPVGVALELGYAEPSQEGSVADADLGAVSYELDQRLFMFGVDLWAEMPLPLFTPYAGIGWGLYFLRSTTRALEQENSASQTRSGLQLRGGAAYAIGPGEAFAELRYHYVGLRFLPTGRSNVGGFTMSAGYRFGF